MLGKTLKVLGMKEVGFVGEALTKAERALKAAEIALSNSDGSGIGIGKEVQKATQASRHESFLSNESNNLSCF